jgi:hypothetical protein
MIYLATPYSHSDPAIREWRYQVVTRYAAALTLDGEHVFSPITHSHPMVEHGAATDWEYWREVDLFWLDHCKLMHVLCLDGYSESTGVKAEIEYFHKHGRALSILYLGPSAIKHRIEDAGIEWPEHPSNRAEGPGTTFSEPKAGSPIFPDDSAERLTYPVKTGLLDYFPRACAAVAHHSYVANDQHNPGEPMHWAKEKSVGTGDQIVRHVMEGDLEACAWRALELLERKLTGLPPFNQAGLMTQDD